MTTIERAIEKLSRDEPGDGRPEESPVSARGASGAEAPATAAVSREPHPPRAVVSLQEWARAFGMVPGDLARSHILEEYRRIKRPLLVSAEERRAKGEPHANLVMVTSALAGEGKTFTAVNLAMSLAMERDKTVLLVDADLVKSSLNRIIGSDERRGIADYLAGEVNGIEDILLDTDVPNLKILPSGRAHALAAELLASDAVHSLIGEIDKNFPHAMVIFDTPPLLVSSEAFVLTGVIGQVVVVIEAEKTTREELDEALALIDGSKLAGLVLNKCPGRSKADYYAYHRRPS